MGPTLTFDQWRAVFQLWNDICKRSYLEPGLGQRFTELANCLRQFGLASPEDDTYKELADITRHWLSTHYIVGTPPRQDARRYWNLWKYTYGERLGKVYSPSGFDDPWMRPGYIYILKMGDWYKIGRTDNVMRRFPQIHVKMPLPTYLWCVFYVDDMYERETLLHEYYAPFRTNGEWFELPSEDVCSLHALQPNACSHIYQRHKHMQAPWRQDLWEGWDRYYKAHIGRVNAVYAKRMSHGN